MELIPIVKTKMEFDIQFSRFVNQCSEYLLNIGTRVEFSVFN